MTAQLTALALAEIDRDLDDLITPGPDTIRALTNEIRALRRQADLTASRKMRLEAATVAAARILNDTLKGN